MATAVTVSATATGSKSISSPVKITATVDASSTPPELAETIFNPGLPEANTTVILPSLSVLVDGLITREE